MLGSVCCRKYQDGVDVECIQFAIAKLPGQFFNPNVVLMLVPQKLTNHWVAKSCPSLFG